MPDVKSQIVQVLGRGTRKARFVPEVSHQVAGVSPADVERALEELEADGRVLIREQYCADPHLVGTDLRIVGLIQDAPPQSEDPLARAVADIEATWNRWLGDYLANHRCG
jgi:hypothetical protein